MVPTTASLTPAWRSRIRSSAFTSESSRERRALTYATIVASERPALVISTTSLERRFENRGEERGSADAREAPRRRNAQKAKTFYMVFVKTSKAVHLF